MRRLESLKIMRLFLACMGLHNQLLPLLRLIQGTTSSGGSFVDEVEKPV